ncbi:MAG TPA: hypothetical protein VFE32_11200 [Puia sp.]|jgi:hypothetical protein|nr:hypothetical protein [Puia sp.]
MKTATLARLLFVIAFTGMLASCNKSNSNNNNSSSNANLQTNSDDETRVSTETDAAIDDVNTAMAINYNVTGAATARQVMQRVPDGPGSADSTAICDAVITLDTAGGNRQITITYNGANCALDRVRTGSITITWPEGQLWSTSGAVVTVQFNKLAIKRLLDNKTITLNGTHTYTNVSGGSLITLPNNPGASVTHTITSSNMQITFDNGTQRTWNVARQRVFTYNGGYVITTTGLHTDGTTSGISEWGADRFGTAFTVAIIQPRVITEACSWQMTAGQVALSNTAGTTTITYGLNSTGTSTSCPVGSGTYYFELSWTAAASGKTYTFILPY